MPTILVTGYGGFLGAAICQRLLAAGYQVRGLARNVYPDLETLGVVAIQGDMVERRVVLDAVRGCDAIINTAAKAGVWGPWEKYYQVNTLAVSHLLEAACQHDVPVLVQTSSPSVTFAGEHQSGVDESAPYPERWLCHYPHTKALAEQAILAAASEGQIRTCALRPHLIWGLGDPHLFPRVIQRTLEKRLKCVGDGKNLIDIVHVDAAAEAHVQAVARLLDADQALNGQALFLTDGQPIPCWEWIRTILETADVPVPASRVSFATAYRIGAVLETAYRAVGARREPPMTRFVAAQLALDHYFSIDKAQALIDYRPEVDREAELERCRPWLRGLAKREAA